jgi:starvation-inducible DNA-binding protein
MNMNNELSTRLNGYLADVAVSYVKTHNLHWNVVGPRFKETHEFLETVYDAFNDILDDTAELLVMNGAKPLASMKDYLAVTKIKELDSKDISINDALTSLLNDLQILKQDLEEIFSSADADHQYGIDKLSDNLSYYSKTIWFVQSMLK